MHIPLPYDEDGLTSPYDGEGLIDFEDTIAADFNIRMIIVKVRQHRQGYPLTKINVLAYTY